MDCTERLDAYFDGELDLEGNLAVEAHLETCARCQGRLADYRIMRQALQSPQLRYRPRPRRLPLPQLLAAALLALVLGLGYWLSRPDRIGNHIQSLLGHRLTQVASSEHHTVKPWFQGRLDYSPPVPDLSSQGFPLLGARLDGGTAVLVYQRRLHMISIFVWPENGPEQAPENSQKRGYNAISWRRAGWRWVAVSDLNADELAGLVELLSPASTEDPGASK
jgi:anti-sigma factor RsiW